MGRLMVVLGAAAMVLAPAAAMAQGEYAPTGSRITRGGAPRPAEPFQRKDLEKMVERMFEDGDTNRDGTITLAEFNAEVTQRKERIIAERFARVDSDRNGSISAAEFAAWQRTMGSVVLSNSQDIAQESLVPDELPLEYGRKDDISLLSRIVKPLSATTIVEANADYDAGMTLAELNAYQFITFDRIDANKDGWLTWDETESLMPRDGRTNPGAQGE